MLVEQPGPDPVVVGDRRLGFGAPFHHDRRTRVSAPDDKANAGELTPRVVHSPDSSLTLIPSSDTRETSSEEVFWRTLSRPAAPGDTSPVVASPLRGADDKFATEWVYCDEEDGEQSQSLGGRPRF